VVDAIGERVTHRQPSKEIDVDVILPLAILAAILGLAFARAFRGLRGRLAQAADEPHVTLSVLPGHRAVVTVDTESARCASAAHLVDQAVQDALTFDGVDGVEVRRTDGELLELRLRPTPGWATAPVPATPPAEGRPPLALHDPDL
jgi:hypothetical protein